MTVSSIICFKSMEREDLSKRISKDSPINGSTETGIGDVLYLLFWKHTETVKTVDFGKLIMSTKARPRVIFNWRDFFVGEMSMGVDRDFCYSWFNRVSRRESYSSILMSWSLVIYS